VFEPAAPVVQPGVIRYRYNRAMASGRTSRLTRAVGLALARQALRRCLAGSGAEAALVAVLGVASAELVEGEQQ
jgi:hypothetical protein